MHSKKRILIIDHSQIVGGAEKYIFDIIKNINKSKYEIFIASCLPENAIPSEIKDVHWLYFESKKIKTWNLPRCIINGIKTIKELVSIVKENNIDIVQSNTVRAHLLGVMLSLLVRKKLIWIIHSYDFNKVLFGLLSVLPSKIVFVSESISRSFTVCKKRSDVAIICNGFDMNSLGRIKRNYLREQYCIAEGAKIIGIIGRIEKEKGQRIIVESVNDVLEKIPDCLFVFVGETNQAQLSYCNAVQKQITEKGLEKYTRFLGHVDNILDIIAGFNVLVQPATADESFGRVLMEALAVGCPVIASNVKGYSDIIENGVNGILVPKNNPHEVAKSIVKMLREKEVREKLVENGRRSIDRRFQLTESVVAYEHLVASL